jgi:N-acetylmuramoyl-L-alanine amidase
MKILNHKLVTEQGENPVPFIASPNHGGIIAPEYLVIHFTAGRSAASSIDWFKNPAASASAHLVIGLDGSISQMVPFNKKAWHAGVSRWNSVTGLNNYSIGIELDNPGKLRKVGDKWISWFGAEYASDVVLEAVHKHQDTPAGWHVFTSMQLDACILVSQLLISHYGLKDVLGHDDIAPFRKEDPGPAFPMESFKARVLGRSDDVADIFKVNVDEANFRVGPGTGYEIIGTLARNTKVEFLDSYMGWYFVYVASSSSTLKEKEGWVYGGLLVKE